MWLLYQLHDIALATDLFHNDSVEMKNIVGPPAIGADFFDRPIERELVWSKLTAGSLIVTAPRRVGKTSLMFRLETEPAAGWRVIHFSVESARTAAEFVGKLVAAVRKTVDDAWWTGSALRDLVDGVFRRIDRVDLKLVALEVGDLVEDRWERTAHELISRLASDTGVRTAIMIDEFPFFVDRLATDGGREAASHFVHWFRELRQAVDTTTNPVRFLLYGSVGLDSVLSRHRLTGAVNDLDVLSIGPLDETEATRFLAELSAGESVPLPPDARDRLLERLAHWYIPFHLQLAFSKLKDGYIRTKAPPTAAAVDRVFEEELLSPAARKHFEHWWQRLDMALPGEAARFARRVLTAAAQPEGVAANTVDLAAVGSPIIGAPAGLDKQQRRDVESLLLHDGYLVRDGHRLRFASPFLARWWRHWYPVGE